MENGWSNIRGQNGNCTNPAWDVWDSRYDWSGSSSSVNNNNTNSSFNQIADHPVAREVHALMHRRSCCGSGPVYHPDPHLMCLKLGKRHYFEDPTARPAATGKRGKAAFYEETAGVGTGTPSTAVPRCQVEGCHVALVNAREYHRRHKVCEMHSKAPKVVVLGLEQRFCQQCSRFHVMTEFDEAKRSCRRRLAGHNERRRKSSSSHDHHSLPRNPSHENRAVSDRFPNLSSSSTGRVLSLLSSSKHNSWTPPSNLSTQCSAALRELIAENRAATTTTTMARPLMSDYRDPPSWHHNHHHHHPFEELHVAGGSHNEPGPYGFGEGGTNLTLDLMQPPSSDFGFLSVREKSSEDEGCSELWTSLGGTHVV